MSFESEFTGLFWADGNIMLDIGEKNVPNSKTGKVYKTTTVRLRFRIIARDDNLALLEAIKERLGGHIYKTRGFKSYWANGKQYNSKPQYTWQVQSHKDADRILSILEKGVLPAKKAKEVPLARQALTIMQNRKGPWKPEELDELWRLKRLIELNRKHSPR